MLHIVEIKGCKKLAWSFTQAFLVFMLMAVNVSVSMGSTKETLSEAGTEAAVPDDLYRGLFEIPWRRPLPNGNWGGFNSPNTSFLSNNPIPVKSGDSMADVAQKTNNPVSDLWMLFMQNDFSLYGGDISDGKRVLNSFKFQPVMPMLLTEEIRLINRPVFQFQSFDTPELTPTGMDWDRKTGLGDTILMQVLAPADSGADVYGVGWTHILPTATNNSVGGEKWAVGPAATYFHLGQKWVVGGVLQHWWDYAGDSGRADINLTDFQYVLRYKVSPLTQIGTGPNIQYNWETDELSLPIGLGMDTTTKWGETIFRYGFDVEYYVHQDDDFGPEWNIRFFFIPVVKAAAWATKPLFR
jgi:hypothetical protein